MSESQTEAKQFREQTLRLAHETGCDPTTARRFLKGLPLSPMALYALRIAADKLGFDYPGKKKSPPQRPAPPSLDTASDPSRSRGAA